MGDTIKVLDHLPVPLPVKIIDGEERVSFIQKCCRCGLRHSIKIVRKPGAPFVDITFVRLKDIKK